jgi:hypothetical protein
MGHLQFLQDLFHPHIDVLGQMVLNHKETRQIHPSPLFLRGRAWARLPCTMLG